MTPLQAHRVVQDSLCQVQQNGHFHVHVATVGAPRRGAGYALKAHNIVQDSLCQVQQNALPAMGSD